MGRKLVSFDFDMTLFDHATWSIPESAEESLRRLKENGHVVVIATGRDMDNYYSRPYLKLMNADARIEQNGTKVIAGGEVLLDHRMDRELVRRILSFCEERGYGAGFTVGDDDFYVTPEEVEKRDMKLFGVCGRKFRDPWRILEMDVRTILFIGSDSGGEDIREHFPELSLMPFAKEGGADIVEKEFNKSHGLKLLAEHYGVDMADTYAFGDSLNDIDMLRAAAVGIAMGNAYPAVKEAADDITDDIGRDGVRNALIKYGLI